MEGFFTFIFTAILLIYLLGFLGRFIFRIWLSRRLRDIERNGGNTSGQPFFWSKSWGGVPKSKEGSVKVTKNPKDTHKVDKTLGEYVEYEEIKETDSN